MTLNQRPHCCAHYFTLLPISSLYFDTSFSLEFDGSVCCSQNMSQDIVVFFLSRFHLPVCVFSEEQKNLWMWYQGPFNEIGAACKFEICHKMLMFQKKMFYSI